MALKMSARIRQLREAAGLNQAELARKVGVTDAYINQLERGNRKNPSLAVLTKLARALGADVGELLKGGGR